MFNKKLIGATAVALAFSWSAQADSGFQNSSSTQIRISAFVPVICHVNIDTNVSAPDADGMAVLGTAHEFCNAPLGYRVVAQHAAGLEGAALISNGERIPLSPSGETVISDISHANIRNVALAADLGNEPTRFRSLSIRIEARG